MLEVCHFPAVTATDNWLFAEVKREVVALILKEINVNDKLFFDDYFKLARPEVSEMTFTNLFMWRNFYNIRYTVVDNLLCILSLPDKEQPFAFMPLGEINPDNLKNAVGTLKKFFNDRGTQLTFKRVKESDSELLKPFSAPEGITYDRDNSDYLYLTGNLTGLTGKKYHGKRNHINKFLKLYEYEYVDLEPEYVSECKRIMDLWCSERNCDDHKDLYCEKIANFEVLDNFKQLGCKGALIKVNGRFEAFTAGELLNDETAVIHIEKANNSIEGLYTFINQQFCLHEWKNTTYVNREQDLGIEGLRKAKLSYNPVGLVNKYVVNIV